MGFVLWDGAFSLLHLPMVLAVAGHEEMAHEWTLGWGDMSLRLLLVLF